MPNSIVLDSYAVIAFLKKEPGYKSVAEWLAQAKDGSARLGISVVNLGEVWYRAARWRSPKEADQIVQSLRALEIEVIAADWALTQIAAQYKTLGNIAYADCFAAALAKHWNAPLVTGDREFKQLQSEIKILWLS
jgi:predicted nucleic acid-binding protein